MLGLAQFQHIIDSNKKRIYSVTLVCLLVFSGLLGAFITFRDTTVSAWSPSTYNYTDNFDNETEGQEPEGDTWYSYYNNSGLGNVTINTSYSISGTKSAWMYSAGSSSAYFNLTNISAIEYVNLSVYVNDSVDAGGFRLKMLNDTSVTGPWISWDYTDDYLKVYYSGSWHNASIQYSVQQWQNWSFILNYTSHEFQIVLEGVNQSWFDFRDNINNISYFVFGGVAGELTNVFFDDFGVGSPTQIGSGGGGYPTIDSTAFNESLPTTVSGNHSLTFDNDTGSPAWSNSSGTTNETMNISIVDGNTSVTFVNISMFNLSDGSGHYINADNLWLYVYNASAASWVNKSNFPTNGGNISLDNADTNIGVTWPISGNQTILCRFKLVIPGGTYEATYTQTSLCGVYIGG